MLLFILQILNCIKYDVYYTQIIMNDTIFIYNTLCSIFFIGMVTLPMILNFFSGTKCVPPLCFPHDPVLNFADNEYPTVSTCALQLTLPTKYDRYCEPVFGTTFLYNYYTSQYKY